MHPVTKTNFGPNGIQVYFNNGTSTAAGHIVKQTGTSRFIVTADGINNHVATLATTASQAGSLAVGQMTILVGMEHVTSLYDSVCQTAEGNRYPWNLGVSVNGSEVIAAASASVWTTTGTLPPVTGGSSYSATLVATAAPGTYTNTFSLVSGVMPGGLALSPTGVISGTATNPASTWTEQLEFVVSNGLSSESQTFSLTVNNTPAPVIPVV
jgi:hypothetical protein